MHTDGGDRMSSPEKHPLGPGILICTVALIAVLAVAKTAASCPFAEVELRLLEEPRPLPELSFVDAAGRPLRLADFHGKTVLLNIWATWCAPCRKEMPSLNRLQAELGGPKFEVVALSVDEGGVPDVESFYNELKLETLAIYVDPSGAAMRTLRVLGVPTTLLVDTDGNEIGRAIGPDQWDAPAVVRCLQQQMHEAARL
jgi:thiol-disulfide isomerase/thioredoxin